MGGACFFLFVGVVAVTCSLKRLLNGACWLDRWMMALLPYLQKGKSQSREDRSEQKQTSETMKSSNRKEKKLKSQESVLELP